MSDFALAPSAHIGPHGVIRIDVAQVLGRLHAAVGHDSLDRYLVACAAVQFWADLLATCRPRRTTTDEIDEALRRARREADLAAQVLVKSVAGTSHMSQAVVSAWVELGDASRLSSLDKALHLPLPECCGYNVADIELIPGDGARLAEQVGTARPILIVGIRTGGTYLAPLWKAVMTGLGVKEVSWCTVRPCSGKAPADGLAAARAWLEHRIAPVVVIVDDQPDTGATMEGVASMLHSPGIDLWFSCVGSVWRGPMARTVPIRSPEREASRRRNACLWQCLLVDEHPRFMSRLCEMPGLPALPDRAQLQFRCPTGEARYGLCRPWLPWNHPHVLSGRRALANPRKTPLVISGPEGEALLHLRFVGEGVFGRAESERIQNMHPERRVWFIDGYAVTGDIGPTQLFREYFHGACSSVQADLLVQTANWLAVLTRDVVAYADHSSGSMALGLRWSALVDAMRARCGRLPEMPGPLRAFLERPVPWLGRTGRAIRSSLRYSCADWHWQVDRRQRLHRFQLDANWGGVSFLELEVAAFAVENRLSLEDTRCLSALCEVAYSSVQESLTLAALTIAEARLRSVKKLSGSGRIALRQDFDQLLMTVSDLAGFTAH